MTSYVVCPDVSKYQVPLNSTYPRDVLIFRVTFGSSVLDSKFLTNANAAAALYKAGKIAGVILYHVYTNESVSAQYAGVWKAIGPTRPSWLIGIMEDVESWRGTSYSLSGDHSTALNQLCGMHAAKLGSFNSVIAYGNWGDLTSLYPRRDARVRFIEAKYSSEIPSRAGKIGQQYTDGTSRWPVPKINGVSLPTSTSPFGHCDHNVFPGFANGHALRAAMSAPVVVKPPAPKPPAPAKPYLYPPTLPVAIRSNDRNYVIEINSHGQIEIHKNGATTRTI